MAPRKKQPVKRTSATRAHQSFDDVIDDNEALAPRTARQPLLDAGHQPEVEPDELAAQDTTGLARYSNAPVFDANDLFIPRLRLAQGLTAEVQQGLAKPGDWLVMGADPLKNPTIIPMLMVRRRELRDTDETRVILCQSSDSIIGIGDPGGKCATCPMNQWSAPKKPGGKGTPPPCVFIYSYIVFVVDTEELCILEFSRTSIPAGKMLNTMVLQKGLGKFAVQLHANGQRGPAGTYYAPSIQAAKIKEGALKVAQKKAEEMF